MRVLSIDVPTAAVSLEPRWQTGRTRARWSRHLSVTALHGSPTPRALSADLHGRMVLWDVDGRRALMAWAAHDSGVYSLLPMMISTISIEEPPNFALVRSGCSDGSIKGWRLPLDDASFAKGDAASATAVSSAGHAATRACGVALPSTLASSAAKRTIDKDGYGYGYASWRGVATTRSVGGDVLCVVAALPWRAQPRVRQLGRNHRSLRPPAGWMRVTDDDTSRRHGDPAAGGTAACDASRPHRRSAQPRLARSRRGAASASADGAVRLWDLNACCCVASLLGHSAKVLCMSAHLEYPQVAAQAVDSLYTADSAAMLHLWQPQGTTAIAEAASGGGAPPANFETSREPVASVAAAHESEVYSLVRHRHLLITAGADRRVRLWAAASLEPEASLDEKAHTASVFALAIVKVGSSGGDGEGVSAAGAAAAVAAMPAAAGDGRLSSLLASADAVGTVILWDLDARSAVCGLESGAAPSALSSRLSQTCSMPPGRGELYLWARLGVAPLPATIPPPPLMPRVCCNGGAAPCPHAWSPLPRCRPRLACAARLHGLDGGELSCTIAGLPQPRACRGGGGGPGGGGSSRGARRCRWRVRTPRSPLSLRT